MTLNDFGACVWIAAGLVCLTHVVFSFVVDIRERRKFRCDMAASEAAFAQSIETLMSLKPRFGPPPTPRAQA